MSTSNLGQVIDPTSKWPQENETSKCPASKFPHASPGRRWDRCDHGFHLWRFSAKVAVFEAQWRQTFGGDSPPQKWRFWQIVEKTQKVAFSESNLAIFRYFLTLLWTQNFVSKIAKFLFKNHLKLNFFCQNLAQIWRKVAILIQNLAKSGDFLFIFGEIVAVLTPKFVLRLKWRF